VGIDRKSMWVQPLVFSQQEPCHELDVPVVPLPRGDCRLQGGDDAIDHEPVRVPRPEALRVLPLAEDPPPPGEMPLDSVRGVRTDLEARRPAEVLDLRGNLPAPVGRAPRAFSRVIPNRRRADPICSRSRRHKGLSPLHPSEDARSGHPQDEAIPHGPQ